jgi:glycolate oxidase iron-sulfur subunit
MEDSLLPRRLNSAPGFQGSGGPQEEDLYRCVHCGLCLSACPTYIQTGLETESPRGRIALMKAVKEGRLGITPRVASHWDLCLGCRACETACPSGVPYGRLIEAAKSQAQAVKVGGVSWRMRAIRTVFLRGLLPRLWVLRLAATGLRIYQRWGLQWLVRRSRVLSLAPGGLGELESQLPVLPKRFFGPKTQAFPARGDVKTRVALLSGCVMPLVHGPTMEAAIRVLQRNGCEVIVPPGQGCCGALNLHSGDEERARRMARRNIDVFMEAGVERVVVASAGCGSAMKEYAHLLRDDPTYGERAETFSRLAVDITEFLASLPLDPPRGELRARVTYQDACHLAHAQGIREAPRALLRAVPGLDLVEMEKADGCCGAAGIYSLVQREMSGRVLDEKMGHVVATGADMVVAANPGCVIQLEMGLKQVGIEGRVCHVVDVLDEAYSREEG